MNLWKRHEPHDVGVYSKGALVIERLTEVSSGDSKWRLSESLGMFKTLEKAKKAAERLS